MNIVVVYFQLSSSDSVRKSAYKSYILEAQTLDLLLVLFATDSIV